MALRFLRRALLALTATAVLAPVVAVTLTSAPAAAAPSAQAIVDLAKANLGKRGCDINSLGGRGYDTSCRPEQWCADFAKWVWRAVGVNATGLTPESGSFYTYGSRNGTMHTTPQLGDAVVYNYHGGGNADHVGLVSAVYNNGDIQVINGNFGGSMTTSRVMYSSGRGALGAVIGGQRIDAFVGGIGVTGSSTPVVRPDLVNQVNGDGYADLTGIAANGELFGYNNGTLINDDRIPYHAETWRITGSNWTNSKFLASADMTGDGFADLVSTQADGSLSVYANGSKVNEDGDPYRAETWHYNGGWGTAKQLAAGDVTGDGFADVVAVTPDGALSIYVNGLKLNNTPFGAETWHIAGNWAGMKHVMLVDINHDNFADLVGVDANGELFGYNNGSLVNQGRVPFASETWRITGSNWSGMKHVTTGEATGDKYGDLIAVEADGSLSVYANNILNTPAKPYSSRTFHMDGDWSSVRALA